MPTTVLDREKLYIKRMRKERGMTQVRVWVPAQDAEKVRALGEELREKFRKTRPTKPSNLS